MNRVRVAREDLLTKLRENRENHVDTFEQVLEAYRTEAIKQLEGHIEGIRNGDVAQVRVVLPRPQNYEEEYDRAIAMLEWEQDDVIELRADEFDSFVLDNWSWKQDFQTTASTYHVS